MNKSFLWRDEHGCSEERLTTLARELAQEIRPGDRIFLEGQMGVGKTTFARALLLSLGVRQPPEGSPTFAIAHEYDSPLGDVIHLDLYRLEREDELDEAGVPAYFWERKAVVLVEWISLFEEFSESIKKTGPVWEIEILFDEKDSLRRTIKIRSMPKL